MDVLFVVDTTGSMAKGLAAIKQEMRAIVALLERSGLAYRIAIIDVKDVPDYPNGARTELGFTNNATTILTYIDNLTAAGGGDTPEALLSGLMLGFTNSDGIVGEWRDGANKSAYVFTDADFHDPEEFGQHLVRQVVIAAGLALDPVVINTVVIGDEPYAVAQVSQLAALTGGNAYHPTSFEEMGDALYDAVSSNIPPIPRLDGATVQFASSIVTVTEAITQAVVPIFLSASLPTTTTVEYHPIITDEAVDRLYAPISGTLVFPPHTTFLTVTVPITNNMVTQPTQFFGLRLSNPRSDKPVQIGEPRSMAVAITDDDQLGFANRRPLMIEGNTGVPITITLKTAQTMPLTLTYTISAGTASARSDFIPITGTVRLAPGQLYTTVAVTLTDDTLAEADETVFLTLNDGSNPTTTPNPSW